ncbi:TetR/AcrR family transcriptional regulator [Sphingobium nicotianae]|uniref:TetR/AcrR family transcriptional regulator n=1 Tax=Sphingobium nicotianae TaxID=2782607 RepID=A0A9X1DFT7_9SPHN|nr:TetR/AcrR family transcriptional regulator [Sphingobium nicotianae]MBT2189053.1 TetR/AcrR family transcriptional regulator [Sphingobium nicotianae]
MQFTPLKTAPSRRDARERRDALIEAAAACFAEKGYTVPLEEIADRAGVGRGTLYRNFRDRMALALAVFERDIEGLEAELDLTLPTEQVIGDLLRRGAEASALFRRLAMELPLEPEHLDGFHKLGERVTEILRPLVVKAHATGAMRPELGPKDLLLCIKMTSGLLLPRLSEVDVQAQIDAAISLLLRGLRAS